MEFLRPFDKWLNMTENPYESPPGASSLVLSAEAKKNAEIARNIRAICILYTVFGVLFSLAGLGLLLGSGDSPHPPPRFIVWIFLLGGSVGATSAIGVVRKKAWGIPVCAIISAFYLCAFPIGTILGGYFLLNIWKVKKQFQVVPAELA